MYWPTVALIQVDIKFPKTVCLVVRYFIWIQRLRPRLYLRGVECAGVFEDAYISVDGLRAFVFQKLREEPFYVNGICTDCIFLRVRTRHPFFF